MVQHGLCPLPRGLAVLLALSLSVTAAPVRGGEDKARSDQDRIQGTWECIATLQDGKQVDKYVGVRAVMQGDHLTWIFPQPQGKPQVLKAVFQLDPGKNPKSFEWHPEAKPAEVHKRLYLLEGDTLIWSTNLGAEPAPESFTAGRWLFVMKRVAGQD